MVNSSSNGLNRGSASVTLPPSSQNEYETIVDGPSATAAGGGGVQRVNKHHHQSLSQQKSAAGMMLGISGSGAQHRRNSIASVGSYDSRNDTGSQGAYSFRATRYR